MAAEVAQHIADRVAARERESPDNDEGAPMRERPSYSDDDPFAAGRNEFTAPCPYSKT
jgi:hypothetical protein